MSRKGEANAPPDSKSRACDLGHTLAALFPVTVQMAETETT
jgi:hypothetical protein